MKRHRSIALLAAAAALVSACGAAHAVEIVVTTQPAFVAALIGSVDGDIITLMPSGSPYNTNTGFAFANKRLTIRGSGATGNPASVVLDGLNSATVLTISGANAEGSQVLNLTIRNGLGPSTVNATGAGIFVHDIGPDAVVVGNCIIRNNVVPAVDGNGAGLAVLDGNLDLSNTRFETNSVGTTGSTGDGGALYINQGDATIRGCIFVNNTAGAVAGGLGGAAWVDNGAFTFAGCSFTGSSAASGGAIYAGSAGDTTFHSCLFALNEAAFNGGGLYLAADSDLHNCLIRGNTCEANGEALVTESTFTASSCTIASNTGPSAIFGVTAQLDFSNTIVWGNSAIPGTHLYRSCILQAGAVAAVGSSGNLTANPLFVSAADFHLQATSPAIDRGNTQFYVGLSVDLDGKPRAVDAPASNTGFSLFGPHMDIGAYEFQTAPACYANCDNSTLVPVLNVNDFSCFLNRYAAGCP